MGSMKNFDNDNDNDNEMDYTFIEPIKNGHKSIVFIILLLIVVIFACLGYYFIIDNPKTIFLSSVSNVLDKVNLENNDNINEFNLDVDFISGSKDESEKLVYDILNNVSFSGLFKFPADDLLFGNVVFKYSDLELLDVDYLFDKNWYLKVNNLYDSVINVSSSDSFKDLDDESFMKYSMDIEHYKVVYNSLKNALVDSLMEASYKKSYVLEDDKYLKKITFVCDDVFSSNFLNKLLVDDEFISNYASIRKTTSAVVTDEINEMIIDTAGSYEEMSLYLSIFDNKFVKFVDKDDEDELIIKKEDNVYYYELSEEYTLILSGSFELSRKDGVTSLNVKFDDFEEELMADIKLTYHEVDKSKLNPLSYEKSVSISDLTEDDVLEIMNKLDGNEALKQLFKDFNLEKYMNNI